MKEVIENKAVLAVEDILSRVCQSKGVVDALLNEEPFKASSTKEFEVFILEDNIEYNTLISPEDDLLGSITWRIEVSNPNMAGMNEWAGMAGWKVSCVKATMMCGRSGRLESITKSNSSWTPPFMLLDSVYEDEKEKTGELESAVVWVKSHNVMIGGMIRKACEDAM